MKKQEKLYYVNFRILVFNWFLKNNKLIFIIFIWIIYLILGAFFIFIAYDLNSFHTGPIIEEDNPFIQPNNPDPSIQLDVSPNEPSNIGWGTIFIGISSILIGIVGVVYLRVCYNENPDMFNFLIRYFSDTDFAEESEKRLVDTDGELSKAIFRGKKRLVTSQLERGSLLLSLSAIGCATAIILLYIY